MYKTILVVDDEESICQSLRGILSDEGYEVRTAGSGEDALKAIEEDVPDLVLLDIWLPGMDGLEALKIIKAETPQVPVIMMSGHGTIETAVKATKLGAFDFIEKPFSDQALLDRVQDAVNRAAELHRQQRHSRSISQLLALLSPREREVLELLIDGLSSREIGDELGISKKTVDVHRGHIREKLGIGSVAELVRLVLNNDGR